MLRNIILNYFGNVWSTLMGIIFIPLYIKYLGTESYGLIGVFAVIQGWLALLDMGMASTVGRQMAIYKAGSNTVQGIRNLFRSIEIIYTVIAICMIIFVILLAPLLINKWLQIENLSNTIVIQALYITGGVIAFRWMAGLYQSALSGLQEFMWLNIIKIVCSTLRGIGVIAILIWVSPTIKAFFLCQFFVAVLECIVSAFILNLIVPKATERSQFSLIALKKVWRFAAGITAITLLATSITQIDKLFLSKWLTLTNFGYYSLAGVVASGLLMITSPISNATSPHLVELVAKGDQVILRATYHKYVQLLTITVVPVALVISIFGNHLLLLWIKNPIIVASVAPISSVLIIGSMLNGLMLIPYQLQISYGWTRFSTIVHIIAFIVLVPLIFFAAKYYGALGAAWCWVLLNTGYLTIALPIMHRYLLKGEFIHFCKRDVGPAMLIVFSVLTMLKLILPKPELNRPFNSILILIFVSSIALVTGVMSTNLGRNYILIIKSSLFNLIKRL